VGATLRQLHSTPIRDGEYISFEEYADLIRTRMARCHRDHELWGSLPERLLPQVRDYVWAARDLLEPDERRTSLLHGDLHAGNVFLNGPGGTHEPTGIVDFNDAYEGDPHYDLVAIHAKAFGADKELLRRTLDAYDWDDLGRKWSRRMMALTLVHDYDMVEPYAARIPDEVQTLDDLAVLLWDLNTAGLP
jgi:aminoglycoside phosphotransferase (APT) family kinase protein